VLVESLLRGERAFSLSRKLRLAPQGYSPWTSRDDRSGLIRCTRIRGRPGRGAEKRRMLAAGARVRLAEQGPSKSQKTRTAGPRDSNSRTERLEQPDREARTVRPRDSDRRTERTSFSNLLFFQPSRRTNARAGRRGGPSVRRRMPANARTANETRAVVPRGPGRVALGRNSAEFRLKEKTRSLLFTRLVQFAEIADPPGDLVLVGVIDQGQSVFAGGV